jgi:hypothetical protein
MTNETKCSPTPNWTDKDWDAFKAWISGVLKENVATITFMKKDGTERVMKCTLNPTFLPLVESKQDQKEKSKSDTSLAVYDTEVKEWRSFVIKNVRTFQFTQG